MNILQIAWRNFQQRSLSSILTTLSLALGVALTVAVLAVYGIVSDAFQRNASVGYNLVVGAEGSPLQLTLNSVYYLSQPIENLPYTQYMEFMTKEQRAEQVALYGGPAELGERDGAFSAYVRGGFAIPLALGDYFGQFRVVGTTPQFFADLRHGLDVDQEFEFQAGRPFEYNSEENGYFEAVVGSRVAEEMKVGVGDQFFPTHGDPSGHGHDLGFTIVGVMKPTGTPNDRAAFVNLEGFYLMDGHAKPMEEDEAEAEVVAAVDDSKDQEVVVADGEEVVTEGTPKFKPLPIRNREVTSILVRTGMPLYGPQMQNLINEDIYAQAAAPIAEITKLMELIVAPLLKALMVITIITCVVAAVGVLVSIYNSMNDRKKDIAVMRALGARRDTVTGVILVESLLIATIGGACGWLLAHVGIWIAGGTIEAQTGVRPGLFTTSTYELYILPLILGLAAMAGLLPAVAAYRTNVTENLNA
ncbi:Macrolide export ATP-binding/permease protein MacB [Roseimaritima multifibrata]|uniref:Macrolide export ATP-binding/permease protein MacB n=1 Tax=Roseimaritima multifibrata TaxID=1930274 RepID=A0A517MAJ6_9BACT|nr:ABC transporter permease [Roseimaritima multifibrata]QDS91906.1 Macrolide export ATP-binding/permease protein MacB [Roseimaritima multifibrata]